MPELFAFEIGDRCAHDVAIRLVLQDFVRAIAVEKVFVREFDSRLTEKGGRCEQRGLQ